MTMLRRFFAVVFFVLGVLALLAWVASAFVVKQVEDGTAVTGIAQKVVAQPAVAKIITEQAQVLVNASLKQNGIDVAALGIQSTVDNAVAATVASPVFQEKLAAAVDAARASIASQLTSPASAGQPLVVSLDVGSVLASTIASIPVVGALVPKLTVEPLSIPVASANEFGKVRTAYSAIRKIAAWGGWIGLLLVAIGIVLTPRKRWLIPLGLLSAGIGAGALWAVLSWFTVDRLAWFLPAEGTGGQLGRAVLQYAHQDTIDRVNHRVFLFAAACLASALVSYLIVKLVWGSGNRRPDADGPRGPYEEGAPGHAR